MKIIQTGSTYKIYGEDLVVLDNLPVQTYKVGCGQFTDFILRNSMILKWKKIKFMVYMKKKLLRY